MKEKGMKTVKISRFYCVIILFSLFFLFPLSRASGLSIEVQTPQAGMQISGEVPIRVLIKEGDKPLTVKEGLYWASGVLLEENGREVLRVALQDNGKGEDDKANDGHWSSQWKIKLPQGQYLLYVMGKKDKKLIYSQRQSFSIIPAEVIPPKEKSEEPFYKEIMKLSSKVDGITQTIYKEIMYLSAKINGIAGTVLITVVFISVALLAIGANILVPILKKRKDKESPLTGEKWGLILTALDEAGKKISETEKDISSTFHVHREIKGKYGKVLGDVIRTYEFAVGWSDAPEEYIEPFKAKLWEALERQGIEVWEPEIGKPAPENCEKIPASKDYPYPPGYVAKVQSKGFRIKEGGKFEVVKPPLVEVVTEKNLKGGVIYGYYSY